MVTFSTQFNNKKIAELNKVKITFDDDSEIVQGIMTLGEYYFDKNSNRRPVQLVVKNQTFDVEDISAAGAAGVTIDYGDDVMGKITQETIEDPVNDTIRFVITVDKQAE